MFGLKFWDDARAPHHAALFRGLVGDHAGYFMLIRLVDHRIGVELAFALRTLRSQDVALKRVSALELAGTRLLETLSRSLMCLQLGHSGLSITTQNSG